MNLDLDGKVALITGGAGGIGSAIVRAFSAEGAVPVVADRNETRARELIAELAAGGAAADFVKVDLTRSEDCRRAVEEAAGLHGRLDILVNNAADNDAVSLDAGVDEFRASVEKNLIQVFAITHHARAHLAKSRGVIINIGSKVADTGQGGTSGYAASKGALNALTREWAVGLLKEGVRVNTVVPAEVMTPLYETWFNRTADPAGARAAVENIIPLGRRMTRAGEVADMVVFLASPRSGHTTGQIIHVDGGYVHLDRACTVDALAKVFHPQ